MPAPKAGLDLPGFNAREVADAILEQLSGRQPALVRTFITQRLEGRSGKRSSGSRGSQDRIARPASQRGQTTTAR